MLPWRLSSQQNGLMNKGPSLLKIGCTLYNTLKYATQGQCIVLLITRTWLDSPNTPRSMNWLQCRLTSRCTHAPLRRFQHSVKEWVPENNCQVWYAVHIFRTWYYLCTVPMLLQMLMNFLTQMLLACLLSARAFQSNQQEMGSNHWSMCTLLMAGTLMWFRTYVFVYSYFTLQYLHT